MSKQNTLSPPTKAEGNAREGGPARNTRSRSKGKAVNVVPENSVHVETEQTSVKDAGKSNYQDDELVNRIVAGITKVLPSIIANVMMAREHSNRSERSASHSHDHPRTESNHASNKEDNMHHDKHTIANSENNNKKKKRCTYPTFLAYKPKVFHGEKNPCETVKWLEEMETILNISGCAEEDKVMFVAQSLKSYASTWWDIILQSRGRDVVRKMSWEEFKKLLMKSFCSTYDIIKMEGEFMKLEKIGLDHRKYTTKFNEMSRVVPHFVTPESERIRRYISGLAPEFRVYMIVANPSTFQSAVDLAGSYTDDMIRDANGVFGSKRKWDDTEGHRDRCRKCNKYHSGECNQQTCYRCNETGHIARDCTEFRTCYECGETGHIRLNCPELIQGTSEAKKARAFLMKAEEA